MISLDVRETWTINYIERSRKYIYTVYTEKQHTTLGTFILFISLPCESEDKAPVYAAVQY